MLQGAGAGLVPAGSLPRACCPPTPCTQQGCAWPQTRPCQAQPFQEEAENASVCFWKSPSSPSTSSLTFLPPLPTCPVPLRGGRHRFPSCKSSSPAVSLLRQVTTNLSGEPPSLLSISPAHCYLLLGGIQGRNAACPRERAAAAGTRQAKFSSWLCQGSPLWH